MKKFILGFILGGVISAAVTGFAAEYAVTANPFPITVNGSDATIEGYSHISSYTLGCVKVRLLHFSIRILTVKIKKSALQNPYITTKTDHILRVQRKKVA